MMDDLRKLAGSLSLLAAVLLANPAQAHDTARIAGWNLAGFHPLPIDRVTNFVAAIEAIDPDVILLVEVNKSWIAAETTAELLNRGKCYQRHVPEQDRASQQIALLHKCDVDVSNVSLIDGSDLDRRGYREALMADVKVGEFDFVLVGLHAKAGRGPANRILRDEQAEVIADSIESAVSGAEKDVIVLGDYNMIPVQDQSNFTELSANGFIRFISSEDLVGQFSHITSGGPGNLLDGYGISADHTGEYIEDSLEIIRLDQLMGLTLLEYRDDVSDHLPVIAEFLIEVDDD